MEGTPEVEVLDSTISKTYTYNPLLESWKPTAVISVVVDVSCNNQVLLFLI
jgi:hypothetical protein